MVALVETDLSGSGVALEEAMESSAASSSDLENGSGDSGSTSPSSSASSSEQVGTRGDSNDDGRYAEVRLEDALEPVETRR